MTISAKVICDSVIARSASRLTTLELTYPRFIHAEVMTHRVFSRNSSSSRAIPVSKMLADVIENPVIPIHWGANQSGMQAYTELSADKADACLDLWLNARNEAVAHVQGLMKIGLHKQIANRLLEPWMHITVICSSTRFANWFKLRAHEAAEPHIQVLAAKMREAIEASEPQRLEYGDWHLPFVTADDLADYDMPDCIKKSVARCARGSYLQQHGLHDFQDDIDLHDRMSTLGHWSPFEHQAQPALHPSVCKLGGNFGNEWIQYRKTFAGETGGDK